MCKSKDLSNVVYRKKKIMESGIMETQCKIISMHKCSVSYYKGDKNEGKGMKRFA